MIILTLEILPRHKLMPSRVKSLVGTVSFSLVAPSRGRTSVSVPQSPRFHFNDAATVDAAHALGNELPKLPFEVPLGRPGLGNVKRDTFVRFSDESQKLLGWKLRQLPEIIKDTLQSLNERGLI